MVPVAQRDWEWQHLFLKTDSSLLQLAGAPCDSQSINQPYSPPMRATLPGTPRELTDALVLGEGGSRLYWTRCNVLDQWDTAAFGHTARTASPGTRFLGANGAGVMLTLSKHAPAGWDLELIEEEAYRCKEITGSLLQFVREPGSRRASTDLNGLVEKTIELLSRQARYTAGRFATELDGALSEVTVNEGQLRQVFLGLGSNALDAMDGRGCLTIRTRRARHEIEIEFEDEGPGIPEEVAVRIWDPFFTTKPPGQGTGLGLAIAQGIVADHGGRIEMQSHVGKGSIFRVVLPA